MDQFNYYRVDNLESKINLYLNDIPENVTFSVLPILKWQISNRDYNSTTISSSIKVTRFTSRSLLAESILESLQKALLVYNLNIYNIDLFLMGRPWLNSNEFKLQISDITKIFYDQIKKEIYEGSNLALLDLNNKNLSEKALKLKKYKYKNIYMDNYGEPLLDKNNNFIGYKINQTEYASILTYYNENKLLCNKLSIQEFDTNNLIFNGEALISWTDIRTDFGFIREYGKLNYYYDKNNNLIDVIVNYSCSSFPTYKTDVNLNKKIGVIDFETYGSNLGTGNHQVYAAGFAIKGHTELFYIEPGVTSENFVNGFCFKLFMNNNLDDYTIYTHNLGRFYSVFILKALLKNKNYLITPIWKDNSILSLTIKYNNTKVVILD